MKFLDKVKRIIRKIGKQVEKSVVKVMSRKPQWEGQGRSFGPATGPARGGATGGRGGGRVDAGGRGGRGGMGGNRGGGREMETLIGSLAGLSTNVEGDKTIHVLSNNFHVRCIDQPQPDQEGATGLKEFAIHQYRVAFSDPDMLFGIKKSLFNACETEIFRGAYTYDRGEHLYCTNQFTSNELVLNPEFEKWDEETDKMVLVKATMNFKYIKTLSLTDPKCLQIYNLIIRQCMYSIGLEFMGDNFYDSSAVIKFPNLKVQLWPGYVAVIKPCEKGLLLCIDVIHKVVHNQDLLSLINNLKERHEKQRSSKTQSEFITDHLKGFMLVTPYNKKAYRIDGIRLDKSPMSTFEMKDGSNMSFDKYFKTKYNVDIINKNQPLILSIVKQTYMGKKTSSEVLLVPELCFMTGLSEEMRGNMSLMRELGKHLHMSPADRVDKIQNFMDRLISADGVQTAMKRWGLRFDPNLAPCTVGKLLAREKIVFQNDRTFSADDKNDWTRAIRENKMLVSVPLKCWAVVTGERDEKLARDFIETMKKVATPLGFHIDSPVAIERVKDGRPGSYIRAFETSAFEKNALQLVLCVLPTNGTELYNAIKKRFTREIGIPTQCIVSKTMTKNMMSVATKVVIQINTKLGGEPWKVTLPSSFQDTSVCIGFDYSGKGTRTGVLVGTMNSEYTRYTSRLFEYKEFNDMNTKLKSNIHSILDTYMTMNKKSPPSCVVFFRNNVEEGRIDSGEMDEDAITMVKILQAWSDKNSVPTLNLVYITLGKRSMTRLMSHTGGCGGSDGIRPNQIVNPPPGTVVDTDIVTCDTKYKEFFMVPTVARQGTVRAIQYRVILDTHKFPPAIIEAYTYKMCHLYYNWTGTVNLPSVIQYAGKLAKQATQTIPHSVPHANMESLLHFL